MGAVRPRARLAALGLVCLGMALGFGTGTVSVERRPEAGARVRLAATVNEPPTAIDDGSPTPVQVAAGLGPRPLDVLANDTTLPDEGETLTIVAVTQGADGAVAITGGGSGLTYQPADAYTGPDSFTYTISDGLLEATANVFVDVVIDVIAPVTSIRVVAAATPASPSARVTVTWSAVELLSGVSLYQLQQQTDGGAWTTIPLSPVTATRIQRTLARGHLYAFRVRAKDGSNNLGSYAASRPLRL